MSGFEAVLYYWPIKARNYAVQALAQEAGFPFRFENANLGDESFKASLPFGQVPYLVHGDVKLAQSMAIFRYIGRVGRLHGDSEEEFALSEMLTEEATDLTNLIAAAHYGRGDNYDALFAADGKWAKQMQYLEKLFPEGQDYFNSKPTGHKRLAGGIAVAAVLDIALGVEPTCLDATPKLKKFHSLVVGSPAFDGIRDLPAYFKRA